MLSGKVFLFSGGPIMLRKKGFTLVELMVVVLIVGILAAVAIPLLTGRIEKARWSEACAGAGTIRTAIRAYFAENPTAAQALSGSMSVAGTQNALGITTTDLTGTYFLPANYVIDSVDANGMAAVTVTGTNAAVSGVSFTMSTAGVWTKN
jgi:prepilin-type N-terminal cleavage/methylation domain-containing protein